MDVELAPDDAMPEAPAPRSKAYVRERNKSHGWATPPGNLVMVYLEACERHRVPANSAVIAQLQRRVRLMQSGPWQRVAPPQALPSLDAAPSQSQAPSRSQRPSNSIGYSNSYTNSYSPSQSQVLSPISSHMAVAAATQTAQELRDLILAHVYPLMLGPSLRPGTTGGSGPSSENHAETVSAAAIMLATGGPEGPVYSARAVAHVCQLVDPRTPWEKQLAAVGLDGSSRVVSEAAFQSLLEAAAATASLGELRQAALEVLSRPVGHGTLDVQGLVGALFDYLDLSGQGSIPASELRAAVSAFSPAAAADMYGLLERHPPLARASAELVERAEFVQVLTTLSPGLAPGGSSAGLVRDKTEIAVNQMLDCKIRDPHGYDFSRCYLGPRGLLPVMDALGGDSAFAHLSLANCGLGCGSVERLVNWLQGHPCLTSLDLTNNLIADRGGLALARLLAANPRIVELGIGSTYLIPRRPSRTHHDDLCPSACEDAGPVLEALAANRAARRSSPAEIVRALRQHGPELRALCYSLLTRDSDKQRPGSSAPSGPSDGRVPLSSLREALGEVTAEWGFTTDALDEVLHHERLLGTSTAGRTADDSGRLGVTYDELMQFLRSEDQVVRVSQALRNHLVEAKQIFFSLAPEAATAASISAAGIAGPRTALSTVRQAIVAAASQPGSGWDVSEADLEAVLSPAFMRNHCRAAATGTTKPQAGGSPAAVGPDGMLMSDWAVEAAAEAAGVGVGGGGGGAASGRISSASVASLTQQPADMLITWPELVNTLMYLFNR